MTSASYRLSASVSTRFTVDIPAHESRGVTRVHPPEVLEHEDLPVGARTGPDADRRDEQLCRDPRRKLCRNALEHDREAAEILEGMSLSKQKRRTGIAPSLDSEPSELVD